MECGEFPINKAESEKTADNRIEEKSIFFQNQEIKLHFEEGVEFNEQHIEKMNKILNLFVEIDPDFLKKFYRFNSENNKKEEIRGAFPLSAINTFPSGTTKNIEILFFRRGMNIDIPHRTSSSSDSQDDGFVDNFSGTLAHELTHGSPNIKLFSDIRFNTDFVVEWQERFGWKKVFPPIKDENGRWTYSKDPSEGWRKNEDGRWQKDDYIVMKEDYTSMPEKCIGGKNGYAASFNVSEDICDSVAAFLLNSSTLDEEKCQFLKDKIAEYHEFIKNKSEV